VSLEAAKWYAVIYCIMLFTGIGIPPMPEELAIASAAAVEALHEEVYWYFAWPVLVAGIVSADSVLYWTGRAFGPRLFEYRWLKRIVRPERKARIERRFDQHGIKILLTARLLPPLRTGVFIVAGAVKYPFTRFLAADAGFAVIGGGIVFFGSTWAVGLLRWAGHWAVYVLAAALAAYLLYRYYHRLQEHERKLGADAAPPVSVLELPVKPAAGDGIPPPASGPDAAGAPAVEPERRAT
jgi:membrane protein DedA with SNARE-associated domain